MTNRVAVLIDGDYMRFTLQDKLNRFPTIDDFRTYRNNLMTAYYTAANNLEPENLASVPGGAFYLYRIFYYTADPYGDPPFKGNSLQSYEFIKQLEREKDVAVRRGTVKFRGWKVKSNIVEKVRKGTVVQLDKSGIKHNYVGSLSACLSQATAARCVRACPESPVAQTPAGHAYRPQCRAWVP